MAPHLAQLGAEQIVVRDRDVSNVQESARQAEWFLCAAHTRTRHCDFPMLITRRPTATAADGSAPPHLAATSEPPSTPTHRPDTRRSGRRGAADWAETSCNFYWAAAWEHRCHEHLEQPLGELA
jgi:hypothetical protein